MTLFKRLFLCACVPLPWLTFELGVSPRSGQALAHDGTHAPVVWAQVDEALVTNRVVALTLRMTGLDPDHGVALHGVQTDGAAAQTLASALAVPFGRDIAIQTQLRFDAAPPGIFTLTLDFGDDGQGAVVVMPVPATPIAPQGPDTMKDILP